MFDASLSEHGMHDLMSLYNLFKGRCSGTRLCFFLGGCFDLSNETVDS